MDIAPARRSSNSLASVAFPQSVRAQRLVLKSFEIEERVDICLIRPLGLIIARGARALRMTPTQLTVIKTIIGMAGGALLFAERPGFLPIALLILSAVFDSSDGQLARMTGRFTELGRVLDGLGDYLGHAAIYIAIAGGVVHRGGNSSIFLWMLLAGVANAIQSQMYDYHRAAYISTVEEGRAPENHTATVPSWISWLYRGYSMMQRWLIGPHEKVEATLAARSIASRIREEDRARYRECFYRLVRGWNLFGSNTRFCAIAVLLWFHRIDLFFAFILVPMNLVLIALWLWQSRADRRFLARV